MKQIQYLICYVIHELVFALKTMSKKDKASKMFEFYHGLPNKPHMIQNCWLFTHGKGKFASVLEESTVDGRLHLCKEATQEEAYDFIVSEIPIAGDNSKVITMAQLKQKSINSDNPFSSRSVVTYAETAVKNCKKAVSIGKKLLQADGNLPSGWSRQDYFTKVLDLMYIKIKNEPKSKNAANGDEREEVFQENRPPHWVFQGFMAFVALGPLATRDGWKSSLMTGGKYSFHFIVLLFSRLTMLFVYYQY